MNTFLAIILVLTSFASTMEAFGTVKKEGIVKKESILSGIRIDVEAEVLTDLPSHPAHHHITNLLCRPLCVATSYGRLRSTVFPSLSVAALMARAYVAHMPHCLAFSFKN